MSSEVSSGVFDLVPALKLHPKVDLGLTVSPLETLSRLGQELGISLQVKRDDSSLLAMGGNKVRQLEYYLGSADPDHTDTVLITGAIQSNFVRLCAAAAVKLGWQAVVQLEHRVPRDDAIYNSSGNVLLNHLLGAEIHYLPEGENELAADESLDRLAADLLAGGRHPFVVHLGIDHPPVGGLGYVYCAAECYLQCQAAGQMPDHVIIPSGSGLTHAGFLAGARACGWNVPVHGICVRRDATQQHARISRRVSELDSMLQGSAGIKPQDVIVDDSALAPGYGQLSDQVRSAIHLSAQSEALLLDPVYSGRTMAGLISLVERGVIAPGESALFIHTAAYPQSLPTRLT